MPNALAHVALLSWPLIAAALFVTLPRRDAVLWSLLGAYLLLPERLEYDFPMLPAIEKDTIAAFTLFGLVLVMGGGDGRWLPRSPMARLLTIAFVLSPVVTVFTNQDVQTYAGVVLRAQTPYDSASFALSQFVMILPMLLARRFFADPDGGRAALRIFMLAGLAYSIPVLMEVRLSPQLHEWLYGFRPFEFAQQKRNDGFRPVVFLVHGLWTAIFMAVATVAAVALWRVSAGVERRRAMLASGWLAITVVLSNSLGALLLTAAIAPVVRFASRRLLGLAVGGLALVTLLYPMLRSIDVIPVRQAVEAAAAISPARAQSLQYRIDNEDILLDRANERSLFGWGKWGRARVYDEETGRDLSTTDGRWVIVFGNFGWVGYVSEFGLLTLPALALAFGVGRRATPETLAICAVLLVNLLDMIPNATLTPVTWLLAGVAIAQVEAARARRAPATPAAGAQPEPARRRPRPPHLTARPLRR